MRHPGDIITPRQLELIALVASGYQLAEIGEMKFLSPHTVRNTLATARERTGAKNLTHLCIICLDYDLIRKNGTGYKPVHVERVIAE